MTTPTPRLGLTALALALNLATASAQPEPAQKPRARDLGVPFDGEPGAWNAITDVPGVLVGHVTLNEGDGPDAIRTGVTAVFPRAELGYYPAAIFALNGDGDFTGAEFAEDFGMLRSPIMFTGTWSNGTVLTAVTKWTLARFPDAPVHIPIVADTWDADLSNHEAFPVTEAHVFAALDSAATGPIAEGNVGGGTGMICHYFKGGIGTASRRLSEENGGYTVGVLVQANYGARSTLRVAGVPVGEEITDLAPLSKPAPDPNPAPDPSHEDGSILIVVATDAPVSALELRSMAKRACLGLARCGGTANPGSGDFVIAFATTHLEPDEHGMIGGPVLSPYACGPLFNATVQATEEAIINTLVAAETMTGRDGTVYALPHDRLVESLRKHGRLVEQEAASPTE